MSVLHMQFVDKVIGAFSQDIEDGHHLLLLFFPANNEGLPIASLQGCLKSVPNGEVVLLESIEERKRSCLQHRLRQVHDHLEVPMHDARP